MLVSAQQTTIYYERFLTGLTPAQEALIHQLFNAAPGNLPEGWVCFEMLVAAGIAEEIAQQVVAALGAIEKPQKD